MNAEAIARAITPRPQRTGRGWMVPCVAHEDRTPSLSLADGEGGRLLVYCFAGCAAADVLRALRARGLSSGARESAGSRFSLPRAIRRAPDPPDPHALAAAARAWREAQPAPGTIVEIYLRARCITIPPPPSLRYAPRARHQRCGHEGPAMVAAVQDVTGAIIAVQRTWLKPDGSDKADLTEPRLTLARCAGGAVRLAPATDTVCLAEGVETGLTVQQAMTGLPVWVTCGTGGMGNVILPPLIRRVYIAADADPPSKRAAREAAAPGNSLKDRATRLPPGERAAQKAAARFSHEGREVRIVRPPTGYKDFNDAARGKRAPAVAA